LKNYIRYYSYHHSLISRGAVFQAIAQERRRLTDLIRELSTPVQRYASCR